MTPDQYRAEYAARMTEAQLLDGILGTPRKPGIALALGWLGYHTHRSQHSPAGFPDLCLVRDGRLIFAELKRQAAKHKPTPAQVAWLDALDDVAVRAAAAVTVYLWRPLDLLDGTVEAALK